METQDALKAVRESKTIADLIKPREVFWAPAHLTVREAVNYMCERRTGAVPVMRDDQVAGIFSERDLMERIVKPGRNPEEVLVSEVMSTNLVFIHENDSLLMAKALMHLNRTRHVLIVGSENQLLGLLSVRDVLVDDLEGASELIHELNDKYYEQAYLAKWRISSNRVIIEPYVPSE